MEYVNNGCKMSLDFDWILSKVDPPPPLFFWTLLSEPLPLKEKSMIRLR